MEGTHRAVLDRFEDGYAVLVIEENGKDIGDYLVERDTIPEDEAHQDAVFEVRLEDSEIADIEYRPEETAERRERAQERFDRLSKRFGEDPEE